MYHQHSNVNNHNSQHKRTHWIDSIDLELVFMNSIAICVVLLAIVAADFFVK